MRSGRRFEIIFWAVLTGAVCFSAGFYLAAAYASSVIERGLK